MWVREKGEKEMEEEKEKKQYKGKFLKKTKGLKSLENISDHSMFLSGSSRTLFFFPIWILGILLQLQFHEENDNALMKDNHEKKKGNPKPNSNKMFSCRCPTNKCTHSMQEYTNDVSMQLRHHYYYYYT